MATRPLCGFRDSERIIPVILLGLGEWPDALGRQESNVVPHRHELMRQPMGTGTGLKGDVEVPLCSLLEERDQPRPSELPAKHDIAVAAERDQVKAVLADVDSDLLDVHAMPPSVNGRRSVFAGEEANHPTR